MESGGRGAPAEESLLFVDQLHREVPSEVKAPSLEATVRKFDDVCKKGSEGKECDNLFTIIAHLIRFMLKKMLVLKDKDMQRVLGYDPEPVEKLRKLQRALDRGHIPQRFLEELLGDSMALEAEQVQRMNQPAHLSWEMEQLSEASSHILENQTQEMRGASVALQDSSLRCTELQEENQQLRKQKEQLEMELQKEKNSSQEWETLTEELVKALEQLLNEVDTVKVDRALQMEKWEMQLHKEKENTQKMETINKVQYQALLDEHSRYKTLLLRSVEMENKAFRRREQDQLQHEAGLQELRDLVSTQRETLKQAAQEERLPQEERVNFWNQLMMAEQKELHTQSKVIQSSLEVLQQEVMLWQAQYEGAKEDLQSMEISLKKLSSQCEVLSREKENFQEEKVKLKRKIQTLTRRNRKLLKENEKDKTRRMENVNFLPTIIEEQEETVVGSYESWGPVPQKKKWWTRARSFIKCFKSQNNGSGDPTKQTQDSPPGPLEATPSCSYWVEEQDAPSAPPPKLLTDLT